MTPELRECLTQITNLLVDDLKFYSELDNLKQNIISRRNLVSVFSFLSWVWIGICVAVSTPPDNMFSFLLPMTMIQGMTLTWSFFLIKGPLLTVMRLSNLHGVTDFRTKVEGFQEKQLRQLFLINNSLASSAFLMLILAASDPFRFLFDGKENYQTLLVSISSYFWLCPLSNFLKEKLTFLKYRFWRTRDEFKVPNLIYYYLDPARYNSKWSKVVEKLGGYNQKQELLKAESSELISEEKDFFNNSSLNCLLMNPQQIDLMNLVVNHEEFFLKRTTMTERKSLLWIGLRVLNKEIKLRPSAAHLKSELQQIPIHFIDGRKLSFWDLALLSQDPESVEAIHTPGLEFLPLLDGSSVLSKVVSYPLRTWFKENTALYRSSNLELIGGWNEHRILIGAGAIPLLQFGLGQYPTWEKLGLKNKRLEKIFFEKLTSRLRLVPSVNMSTLNSEERNNLWRESVLTAVHGNLVNFLLEIREYQFDLNIVANVIEHIDFTDLALKSPGKIWLQTGHYLTQDREPLSVFGAYLGQLLKNYSSTKALKILTNSLPLDDYIWRESLNNWLRVERNPELFSIPPLPQKVKDIGALKIHFEKVINLRQNPELKLNQDSIQPLNKLVLRDWEVAIPEKNQDLIEEGAKFKICLGNGIYFEKIKNKESYIFFLKKENFVEYIVEINPQGDVIQARTLKNNVMAVSNQEELSRFCKEELLKAVDEN